MLYNSWNKTPVPGAALAIRGQEFQLRAEIFIAGIPHGTLSWYGPGLAPPLYLTPRAGLCLELVAQTFHCCIVQGRWPGDFSSLWHETARPTLRSEPLLVLGHYVSVKENICLLLIEHKATLPAHWSSSQLTLSQLVCGWSSSDIR